MRSHMAEDRVDASAMRAWLEMIALPPTRAGGSPIVPAPRLAAAVRLVERALLRPNGSGVRSVPSAGAIFPYEVVVVVRDGGSEQIHRVDLTRRSTFRLPTSGAGPVLGAATDLAADYQVVVLARPWLSMRKYGARGYLYTQLDAAHAATSLLGTAGCLAGSATLRTAVPVDALAGLLPVHFPFREMHSVLSVTASDAPPENSRWTAFDLPREAVAESRDELEAFCWSTIEDRLLTGNGEPRPTGAVPPLGVAAAFPPGGALPTEAWAELTQLRRSCKTFADRSMVPADLALAVGAVGTTLNCDLPPGGGDGLGITFVTARPELAEACSWLAQVPGFRVVCSSALDDPAAVTRSCNRQRHLAEARAFLLFHVDRQRLLTTGRTQALRDALFRTGAAAQLVYLGAARGEVATTGVGGYDASAWRQAAGLAERHELLYLLAMGTDQDGTEKVDRLATAVAHGE